MTVIAVLSEIGGRAFVYYLQLCRGAQALAAIPISKIKNQEAPEWKLLQLSPFSH